MSFAKGTDWCGGWGREGCGKTHGRDSYLPADAAVSVVAADGDHGSGAAVVLSVYVDVCRAGRTVGCAKIEGG